MDKVQKALIVLLQGSGTFYAEFFIQCKRIEGKNVLPEGALMATMVKNGRIYLLTNEELYKDMTIEQVAKGLEHEALHPILEHSKRLGSRDHNLWNIAGDLAINSMIKGMDIGLIPGQKEFKDWPKGLTAETYYDMLMQSGQSKPQCQCDGSSREMGDFEREVLRKAAEEAYKAAKTRNYGSLPGEIEAAIIEFIKPPTISWKTLLKKYVAATIKANAKTTWQRESRRGLPIKGKMKDRIIRIALAIDTSGSIFGDPELLAEFYAEVVGIQRAYKAEITVIECDAQVQNTYKLKQGQRPNASPKGGGGTSFVPPYEWLKEHNEKTDVLVYLTDLYGDFPKKEYIRTVWCVTASGADKAPFGRIIKIKGAK